MQVLANGLSNACKQATNVLLTVTAAPGPDGGGCVIMRVLDDGPGLRGVNVAKLFEDFAAGTDVVGSRGAGVKGSGLGLPICARLAKLMGGTLTVRDRPDGVAGAEFSLTLPLYGSDGAQTSTAPRTAGAAVTPLVPSLSGTGLLETGTSKAATARSVRVLPLLRDGRRPRVVYVDDAALNRRIADRYIRSLGCESVLLTDGDELAECVAAAPCDIILMDIKMARMDGDVACRQIRAGGYTGPIIAVRA